MAAGVMVLEWAVAGRKLLLYGDAAAHLMMARRMVDSLTPGLSQWGSVWLPLPHLLAAVLIRVPGFWQSGLAGALVSLAAFVLATGLLHRLVKREFGAGAAAWAAAWFCLNPNLLYIAVTPMDEAVYLAAFIGLVDQCSRYARGSARRAARSLAPRFGAVYAAALFAFAATLTRYDGWFTLPFAVLVLMGAAATGSEAWSAGWRFACIAGAGPALWAAYNWYYYGDPLDFLRGPYSAHAIYRRALQHGGAPYPGDHAWGVAWQYWLKATALDCGLPLLLLAAAGVLLVVFLRLRRRAGAPPGSGPTQRTRPPAAKLPAADARLSASVWLLLLPLPWYAWAMESGNVPVFVPSYWPHGYYNLRYGLELLPAAALFSAAFCVLVWRGLARAGGAAIAASARPAGGKAAARLAIAAFLVACAAAYLLMLRAPGPMVYAEAVHNAPDRLAMEHQLAAALAPAAAPGAGRVLMYLGDYPGALADDDIPLRRVVQESNMVPWREALAAPQRYVEWIVVEQRAPTDTAIDRAALRRYFQPVDELTVPTQPSITVYRRVAAAGGGR